MMGDYGRIPAGGCVSSMVVSYGTPPTFDVPLDRLREATQPIRDEAAAEVDRRVQVAWDEIVRRDPDAAKRWGLQGEVRARITREVLLGDPGQVDENEPPAVVEPAVRAALVLREPSAAELAEWMDRADRSRPPAADASATSVRDASESSRPDSFDDVTDEQIEAAVDHITAIMESGRNPTLYLIALRAGVTPAAAERVLDAGIDRGRICMPWDESSGYRYTGASLLEDPPRDGGLEMAFDADEFHRDRLVGRLRKRAVDAFAARDDELAALLRDAADAVAAGGEHA